MAISLANIKARAAKVLPPRIVVYGPEGIGKSTFADLGPDPIFGRTEEDRGTLVSSSEECNTYDDMIELITALIKDEHDFKTFALDSLDWFEPLVHQKVCDLNGWNNIEEPGYGKGYAAATDLWREFYAYLNGLGTERGMIVIIISHAKAKSYKNPETEAYDRYNLKVRDDTSALAREWADAVFFINYKVSVVKEKEGFNKERNRASGSSERRMIYTTDRPAAIAKNRYDLPEQIAFDKAGMYWGTISKHIPFLAAMLPQEEQTQTETKGE